MAAQRPVWSIKETNGHRTSNVQLARGEQVLVCLRQIEQGILSILIAVANRSHTNLE
jgi:hypothetical protein